MISIKNGGNNLGISVRLKLDLQEVKENNILKENINSDIQRKLGGLEEENISAIMYEKYGLTGVAVLIEAITDNRNITVADMRHLFTKFGEKLGEIVCVNWMFKNKGQFTIKKIKKLMKIK